MSVRRDTRSLSQPCWLIDYSDENRLRHRIRVHCTRSVANRKYLKILEKVENRKLGITTKYDQITLTQLTKKYITTSEIDGKSPLTVKRIQNATNHLMRLIGPNMPVLSINALDIEEFKRIRLTENTPRNKKLSKSSLNVELRHLKALFNWAVKFNLLRSSPIKNVKFIKTESKPVRFLSPDELQSLFGAINESGDRDAFDLFTFYLQLGARRSEILPPKCTWNHIDFDRKTIILIGKRQKRRTMPPNDALLGILQLRINDPYPLNLTPNQVTGIILKYFKKAGIKNASAHTLRKTCGSLLIQAGIGVYKVSKYLGHCSVTVTEKHYIDLLKSEYDDLSVLIGENYTGNGHSHQKFDKNLEGFGINGQPINGPNH